MALLAYLQHVSLVIDLVHHQQGAGHTTLARDHPSKDTMQQLENYPGRESQSQEGRHVTTQHAHACLCADDVASKASPAGFGKLRELVQPCA